MSALDELERSLARAVDAGAAADPLAGPERIPQRRLRPRRGGHVFLAIILAGGATTGALAATGNLPILEARWSGLDPDPRQFGGVRESKVTLLAVRVVDPNGGPPWGLRTFQTNRDASCVQVGQVYRGQFGEAELSRRGARIFRRRVAQQGGEGVMCSGLERGGFPVLRGTRSVVRFRVPRAGMDLSFGGCSMVAGGCKVRTMSIVRFGLLGPAARRATFIDGDGTRTAPQALSASNGGAYLFVVPTNPAPFLRYERLAGIRAPQPSQGAPPLTPRQQFELADREARRRRPQLERAARAIRARDGIDATFANGTTMRVAGKGREGGPLPGVTKAPTDLPASVGAEINVTKARGPRAPMVVSFRSPVALGRFDRHYVVTYVGPIGPACGQQTRRNRYVTTTSFEQGAPVRITLQPYQYAGARQPWCPRPHSIRATLTTGSSMDGGRLVGTTSFTPR